MEVHDEAGVSDPVEPRVEASWASTLFPDPSPADPSPQFYLGEDEEEKYAGVDELFSGQSDSEMTPHRLAPVLRFQKKSIPACSVNGAEL